MSISISSTVSLAGAGVQCAARYGVGQVARGTGFGVAWIGEKMMNGGIAINVWGNRQVKLAQKMWAMADELMEEIEAEEAEEVKEIARENRRAHTKKTPSGEIDIDAYCA